MGRGQWPPLLFTKSSNCRNINASSEFFGTFSVGKDKGFTFYLNIFKLGPPFSTGAKTPLLMLNRLILILNSFMIESNFVRHKWLLHSRAASII